MSDKQDKRQIKKDEEKDSPVKHARSPRNRDTQWLLPELTASPNLTHPHLTRSSSGKSVEKVKSQESSNRDRKRESGSNEKSENDVKKVKKVLQSPSEGKAKKSKKVLISAANLLSASKAVQTKAKSRPQTRKSVKVTETPNNNESDTTSIGDGKNKDRKSDIMDSMEEADSMVSDGTAADADTEEFTTITDGGNETDEIQEPASGSALSDLKISSGRKGQRPQRSKVKTKQRSKAPEKSMPSGSSSEGEGSKFSNKQHILDQSSTPGGAKVREKGHSDLEKLNSKEGKVKQVEEQMKEESEQQTSEGEFSGDDSPKDDFRVTDRKRFVCEHCGKLFKAGTYLKQHLRTHTGEKVYSCSVCGKKFNNQGNLFTHCRIHEPVRPFICTYCGKGYNQKINLKYHLRVNKGMCKQYAAAGTRYVTICDQCGRKFSSFGRLKQHQQHHAKRAEEVEFLNCDFCEKAFQTATQLGRHRRIHTGERPFACLHCDKSFIQKSNLQAHIRVHTGTKPFVCIICTTGFTQGSNLKLHLKNKHKIEQNKMKNYMKRDKDEPIDCSLEKSPDSSEEKDTNSLPSSISETKTIEVNSTQQDKSEPLIIHPSSESHIATSITNVKLQENSLSSIQNSSLTTNIQTTMTTGGPSSVLGVPTELSTGVQTNMASGVQTCISTGVQTSLYLGVQYGSTVLQTSKTGATVADVGLPSNQYPSFDAKFQQFVSSHIEPLNPVAITTNSDQAVMPESNIELLKNVAMDTNSLLPGNSFNSMSTGDNEGTSAISVDTHSHNLMEIMSASGDQSVESIAMATEDQGGQSGASNVQMVKLKKKPKMVKLVHEGGVYKLIIEEGENFDLIHVMDSQLNDSQVTMETEQPLLPGTADQQGLDSQEQLITIVTEEDAHHSEDGYFLNHE